MYYQAAYFKLGKFMGKEFLLADNTYFAFNDYFQFIIEMGLVGIFTILLFFAGLYKLVVTTLAKSKSLILLNSIGILLAICFASCFNFILYRPEFQMIAIVCLTIILYYYSINTDLWKKTFMIIVILLTISLYLGVNGLTLDYYLALEKLKEAKELERAGYRMEAMAITKDLEKKLSTDPEYLELTSFIFTNAMMLKEAKKETHKLIEARPSSDAYLRLGHIYELKNEYPEAERAYLMSIDMVPNRFVSRYKLYQFYKSTGQYEKAKMSAKVILNMPIKIPSVIVDQIKSNVKKDIF